MKVSLTELEAIGREVGVEVNEKNAFAFLHTAQKVGMYRDYPKPNARRKSVPVQKPEVGVGGTIGEWEEPLLEKKRNQMEHKRLAGMHNNTMKQIEALQRILAERGIDYSNI